jgi:hypothetical protein
MSGEKRDKVSIIVDMFERHHDREILINDILKYGYECYWDGRHMGERK